MNKSIIIFTILFLILFTALVKNSTKRIEDKIFSDEENIRILEKDFEKIKLEYGYLSSPERLIYFQDLYFDDKLKKKSIEKIEFIKINE
jgi:hypothetical protein|tara:strand:+ start:1037 stop:1303 length:267 start_codon:yes stop_codon:yes gene_type:complete